MTERSFEDQREAGSDESTEPESGQDVHPAIDPRDPEPGNDPGNSREAPPVDLDERGDPEHQATPDVIELPEGHHVDTDDQPPGETSPGDVDREAAGPVAGFAGDESLDLDDTYPEAAREIVDDRIEAGDTAALPTPPNVAPEDEHFVALDALEQRGPEAGAGETSAESLGEPRAASADASREGGFLGGMASRLGFGGSRSRDAATKTTRTTPPPGRGQVLDRMSGALRSYLDPRLHMLSTVPHRWISGLGLLAILLFLLLNSGGLALITLSTMAPLLILVTLTQHDVFEKESNLVVAGVAVAGAVVGIVLSALASWVQGEQWYDAGVLNYGAAGFGGRFAERSGSAPVVVWLLVGLAIPALALVSIGGIPIALRRWPQFRNEVMDGVILGGASAGGLAIGASLVYWWPMIADPGPITSVRDWTLGVLGAAIVRPIVIVLCGTMVGAGVWRYMISQNPGVILTPAIGGIGGYLLLTFGAIQLQSSGLWAELLWTVLVLGAVFVLYRNVLDQAVADDRWALGSEQSRIVCPACHKVTPAGQFCAHCGHPLDAGAQQQPVSSPT